MTYLQALILGIVQGLTEFISISSTAHLVFASRWTDLYSGNAQQTTATIAVIQLGTLAAVFIYFAFDIWSIGTSFLIDHWNFLFNRRALVLIPVLAGYGQTGFPTRHGFGWLVMIGSIPIGVIGMYFKDFIEGRVPKTCG